MQTWQTAILTALLSILTAIITTKVTAWNRHKNEVKRWLLEKRAETYFSFYSQVELVLQNREKIYDKAYLNSLSVLKPQMKLLSSKKTFKAFQAYYEFIRATVIDYKNFCAENDPCFDPSRIEEIELENGEKYDEPHIYSSDIEIFEWEAEKYKQDNLPDANIINAYIEPLYQAMRNDLGSNF